MTPIKKYQSPEFAESDLRILSQNGIQAEILQSKRGFHGVLYHIDETDASLVVNPSDFEKASRLIGAYDNSNSLLHQNAKDTLEDIQILKKSLLPIIIAFPLVSFYLYKSTSGLIMSGIVGLIITCMIVPLFVKVIEAFKTKKR